jgi:Tol biopolymer transport system component/DNA-binding winged helix-turn-helix (wHTH) protein
LATRGSFRMCARFESFYVDLSSGELFRSGLRVPIQEHPLQVLRLLLEAEGKVVTREQLRAALWAEDTFVDFEHGVNTAVKKLRQALEDSAEHPNFVETLPKIGYRFIVPVKWMADANGKTSLPRIVSIAPPGRMPVPQAISPEQPEAEAGDSTHTLVQFSAQVDGQSVASRDLVPAVFPQARRAQRRFIWIASLSLLVIAGGLFLYRLRRTPVLTLPPMKVVPLTSLPGTKMTPAFSSDGNQVAFAWNRTDLGVEIYVKLVSEGEPRQLTHTGKLNFNPVWSPDGQRIAFTRSSESETAIFTISAYGEGERKLLSLDGGAERRISWSPDGKFLAFADSHKSQPSRDRAIYLLSLDSLEKRKLTSPPADYSDEGPAFSPDGHTLAFLRGSNSDTGAGLDLYVVPFVGGEPRRLTFGDNLFWTGPTWTENGHEIIFSSDRTGSSALWRIPVSGGPPQPLEVGSDDAIEPVISRQGHRLAYMRFPFDLNVYRVVLPDATSPGNSSAPFLAATRLDANGQLSPDGKRIAFESDRSGGNPEIWVCNIDGSNCAPVTSFGTRPRLPRWSPDGKRIVCEASRNGKTSIYTVDLETRSVRGVVADPSEERTPSWSRDGLWIYFASKRAGSWQIWKVLTEGGAPVQITKQGGFRPVQSPDSRFVYYVKGDDVAGVWRVPSNGGEELLAFDQPRSGMSGNWEVVEGGIYFIRFDQYNHEEGAILFYDFASGRLKETAKLGRHHILGEGFTVSSDRRSFLYTVWEHPGGDIMLVENFR